MTVKPYTPDAFAAQPSRERRAHIAVLWEQGMNGTEIANALGLTRSAVMGYLHRARGHGLIGYKSKGQEALAMEKKARPNRTSKKEHYGEAKPWAPPVSLPELVAASATRQVTEQVPDTVSAEVAATPSPVLVVLPSPIPTPEPPEVLDVGVSILDARFGQCRWVLPQKTRAGLAVFCGEAVKPGKSFCPTHHARCFVPPTPFVKRRKPVDYTMRANVRVLEEV